MKKPFYMGLDDVTQLLSAGHLYLSPSLTKQLVAFQESFFTMEDTGTCLYQAPAQNFPTMEEIRKSADELGADKILPMESPLKGLKVGDTVECPKCGKRYKVERVHYSTGESPTLFVLEGSHFCSCNGGTFSGWRIV